MGLSLAELHEVIAYGSLELLAQAAERAVGDEDVVVRTPAEPALTMVRARDTIERTVFNLGEALVTRCEVELREVIGWATVIGDQRRRALCGALLDAAQRGGVPLNALGLEAELERCRALRRERWSGVQATRVDFEEMAP